MNNIKYIFKVGICFIVCTLTPLSIYSQFNHPEKKHTLILTDTLTKYSDSMYIIPESVKLLNGQDYIYVETKGKTIYLRTHTIGIEATIYYKILPGNPDLQISALDSQQIEQIRIKAIKPLFVTADKPSKLNDFLETEEVEYAGAFGRGLSFGNNQNLVLNSTLNMQLSGKLGEDIEINAAISDENLPIQSDGNTQQLNELDNVFVEIKRKNRSMLAGDIQVKPDETYFLRYFKKYKGIQLYSHDQVKNNGTLTTKLQGSVARGNFKRESLLIQEGNQGPYRLTGQNNELFIIVLSGSEKVYLDGQLLTRGLENDYVIDYNRSEISFTARRVLNRNSRIVVEFEYSNQSYFKSALALQSNFSSKRWTVQWNSYQESENKTSTSIQSLSNEDKLLLANAGDQVQNLTRSTIRAAENESDNILYVIKDTTVHNTHYQNILVLDQTKQAGSYTAGFTFVGSGNGNYIIEKELFTNGRAYRWIAPDQNTNSRNGDYEPYISLTAPKKQSMHTLKVEYTPNDNLYSLTEIGLSNTDLNLYSHKDKSNDLGLAWKQSVRWNKQIGGIKWSNELNGERQSTQFTLFEPFRNPEFNRDWAIGNALPKNGDDMFFNFKTGIENRQLKGDYSFRYYDKQNNYRGQMHTWQTNYHNQSTQIHFSGSDLKNSLGKINGKFFRPKVSLQQQIGKSEAQILGFSYEKEKNEQHIENENKLLPQSFSFGIFNAFVQGNALKNNFTYQLHFSTRQDFKIDDAIFTKHYTSTEWAVANQWKINKTTNWNVRLTNRTLEYNPNAISNNEKKISTLIWRQSLDTRTSNEAIRYRQTMESGNGQEPTTEYTYIKVNKGAGYYTWIDINKDSTIQVSEFSIAPFADQGEYLRYAITGNEFILSKNYTFLQDVEMNGMKWRRPDQKIKWYHKLSFLSNINMNWKSQSVNAIKLPFSIKEKDLLSLQGQIRNQLYINRGGKFLEIQIGQFLTNTKWRLSTGAEIRIQNENFIRSRHRLNSHFNAENYVAFQFQKNEAEFFKEKNLNVKNMIVEPTINYQYKQHIRLSTAYRYTYGEETVSSTQTNVHELRLEATAQPASRWSFRSSCSQIWASTSGRISAWNEFNLLHGLRSGGNTLVSLQVDRVLNNNTILRFGYHGRKSQGTNYIQSGNAQILASF